MRLYYATDGRLLAFLQRPTPDAPLPPEQAAGTIDVDPSTTPSLAAALLANWQAFTAPAGVLTRGGAAVTVAPPATDPAVVQALLAKLASNTPLTAEEQSAALAFVLRLATASSG